MPTMPKVPHPEILTFKLSDEDWKPMDMDDRDERKEGDFLHRMRKRIVEKDREKDLRVRKALMKRERKKLRRRRLAAMQTGAYAAWILVSPKNLEASELFDISIGASHCVFIRQHV